MGSNTFFDIAKELFFLVPGELRRVELESVATPSFVTATKEYFGSEEEIRREIEERDYRDMHREISPLVQAEDAVLLDTSDMSLEQVVERITALAKERLHA